MGATTVGRLSTMAVFSLVGHSLGPVALGTWGAVSAYSAYWFLLTDLGLSARLVRDGAAAPTSLEQEFAATLALKFLLLTVPTATIVILLATVGSHPGVQLFALLTAGVSVQTLAYTWECAARAQERHDVEAVSTAVQACGFTGLAVWVLFVADGGVVGVGVAVVAAAVLRLVVSVLLARRRAGVRFRLAWQPELLRRSVPYLASTATRTAYVGIDVIFIALVANTRLVGYYVSVSRPLLAVAFVVGYAANAALPAAVRLGTREPQRLRMLARRAVIGALVGGGLVAALTGALAGEFLHALYGPAFRGAANLLRIAALHLPLAGAAAVLSLVLSAVGREADSARALLVGVGATVVLSLGLVPWLGSLGAVLQLVLSELLLVLVLHRQWQRGRPRQAATALSGRGR